MGYKQLLTLFVIHETTLGFLNKVMEILIIHKLLNVSYDTNYSFFLINLFVTFLNNLFLLKL
jgi:hypothetical protein